MLNKKQKIINKTIEVLESGGIILYPTDTIWGIGCDATNENAINKIYEIKKYNSKMKMTEKTVYSQI